MNTSENIESADIVPRMFACLIDMVIVVGMFIGTTFLLASISYGMQGNINYTSPVLGGIRNASAQNIAPLLLFTFLLFIEMWIYFVPFETSKWQASIGKKILGLKVVNRDGKPMTQLQATGRCFAKFITFGAPMWIWTTGSFLLIVSNPQHRALHDYVVGTVVTKDISSVLFDKDIKAAKATPEYTLRTGGYDKY